MAFAKLKNLQPRKAGWLARPQGDSFNSNDGHSLLRPKAHTRGRGDHPLSGPTRTNCLPKLAPLRSPMNAAGALSRPSVMNSRCLTLPSRTHCDISRKKSPWRAAKSLTMKPRMVSRLVSTLRIIDDAHLGTEASVSLYWAIKPHTGMRAKALSNGNTASNTAPPTFSK